MMGLTENASVLGLGAIGHGLLAGRQGGRAVGASGGAGAHVEHGGLMRRAQTKRQVRGGAVYWRKSWCLAGGDEDGRGGKGAC